MSDQFGREKTNTEWLVEQAAALRMRANPCAGVTPLTIMANRFENIVVEIGVLRAHLLALTNAADAVGVQYFDTDTMDAEVEAMLSATRAANAVLK